MKDSFTDNNCCIFGSSKPDLMFSKHNSQGDLVAAVIELLEQFESVEVEEQYREVHVIESTIEYKRMSITKDCCQCFADMVRVANDSTIDSLVNGILVKSERYMHC